MLVKNHILVRYDEIATKSSNVRGDMVKILRQRVSDRLQYENHDFEKVRTAPGRIIVEGATEEVAQYLKNLPGVSSTSPAARTHPDIESIIDKAVKIDVGNSFGINTNRSGNHSFDSMEVNRKVGQAVEEDSHSRVDLENPETWINIDIRDNEAYIFSKEFEGPGGMPVGSSGSIAALISGGIDSPVAAYRMMTRGCKIEPLYFYNKPLAAEDHLLRFEECIKELKKFNPSKTWSYTLIDMEKINKELMEVGRGLMLLHRYIMFCIADEIARTRGLDGLVTGESMSQKSSQTASNMAITSTASDLPLHRPLVSTNKNDITEEARKLGTHDYATVDSACRDISPENPATEMNQADFNQIKNQIDIAYLVDKAVRNAEKVEI